MKYSKEQISLCLEILKNPQGCYGIDNIYCSICLVEKECQTSNSLFFTGGFRSKQTATQIIKEIIE